MPPEGHSFGGVEDLHIPHHHRGIRAHRRQHPLVALHDRAYGGFVEQVGGVFDRAGDRARCAGGGRLLGEGEEQVEARGAGRGRHRRHRQTGEFQPRERIVLQCQRHLEQRVIRRRASRVQQLHQPLERCVLVLVGRQRLRAYLAEQLPEGGIARHVHPQHPRVDEEPHQVAQRLVGAPGHRSTDRDVLPGAEPMQQHRHRRLQHHRHRRPPGPGQLVDPRPQPRLDAELHHRARGRLAPAGAADPSATANTSGRPANSPRQYRNWAPSTLSGSCSSPSTSRCHNV